MYHVRLGFAKGAEALEIIAKEKKFWGNYYKTVLVVDTAFAAFSTARMGVNIGRGIGKHAWATAGDKMKYYVAADNVREGAEKCFREVAKDAAAQAGQTAAGWAITLDIPDAMRKKFDRYDVMAEQVLGQLKILSDTAIKIRETWEELRCPSCMDEKNVGP
jgi:hypothetical protein